MARSAPGNTGVPMFCPFVKTQERHNGGVFVCIFGNNTAQASHAAKKAKGLASCFVLAVNANRGARPTAPNAMLPSLPAGCFESTTKFAVFLRVVGDVASTVCSAMLAPATNGKTSALMLDADPMRPIRHHALLMRRRRWRSDCDDHLTA